MKYFYSLFACIVFFPFSAHACEREHYVPVDVGISSPYRYELRVVDAQETDTPPASLIAYFEISFLEAPTDRLAYKLNIPYHCAVSGAAFCELKIWKGLSLVALDKDFQLLPVMSNPEYYIIPSLNLAVQFMGEKQRVEMQEKLIDGDYFFRETSASVWRKVGCSN